MAASLAILSGGLSRGNPISLRCSEPWNAMIVGGHSQDTNSTMCCNRVYWKLVDRCLFGRKSIHRCLWSGGTAWALGKLKPYEDPGVKSFRALCVSPLNASSVPGVSYDGLSWEDQDKSTIYSDQNTVDQRTIKLQSGSCYMPHPAKVESGGEDAHFICVEEQVIGVADGVGAWAKVGVNAGLYAQELMEHCMAAIKEEPKGSVNPSRVLEKAYSSTEAIGSSTVCIIALTNQGIHAVNLGDSGFVVVRAGSTIFRSPVQQHDFNCPYQLESGPEGDLPCLAEVFTFPVAPGDVIVAGSDGLFDNLFNNEIAKVVAASMTQGLDPQATAKYIALVAANRALSKNRQTPFSIAAQAAGYRFFGGKLDDLTVVVSFVTTIDPFPEDMWSQTSERL